MRIDNIFNNLKEKENDIQIKENKINNKIENEDNIKEK